MNRRDIFALCAIAVLGLALQPNNIAAQQGTLKQQLVGTWTLVSGENTAANGTKRQLVNWNGILMFDAGGRFASVVGRGDRPKFKSASQPTTEELAAATQDFFAGFGTWSLDEADKSLAVRLDGDLRPNNEGTDIKGFIGLSGNELKLGLMIPASGAKIDWVYRRAK
jgi:hypothetical protein